MAAVDQELLARLTRETATVEQLVRRTGEHDIVDDGKRTTVMDAIDPAALGLDVSASGRWRRRAKMTTAAMTRSRRAARRRRKKKR